MQRSGWMIFNKNSRSGLQSGLSNGCRHAFERAMISWYPHRRLQCFFLWSSPFSLCVSTFPSLSVFRSLSLSLSLCLTHVPTRVTVHFIKIFAIKNLKLPYHTSIVKIESKNFVWISFREKKRKGGGFRKKRRFREREKKVESQRFGSLEFRWIFVRERSRERRKKWGRKVRVEEKERTSGQRWTSAGVWKNDRMPHLFDPNFTRLHGMNYFNVL